jgi:predicted house-cleaning noncanonical NTP pyrophosphatase (MazG superfamily)
MRLPIIKHTLGFIQENDVDFIHETMEVLEHLADARGIKDEELEVIGELISNLAGAVEVYEEVKNGTPEKEALNAFMKRVQGAID